MGTGLIFCRWRKRSKLMKKTVKDFSSGKRSHAPRAPCNHEPGREYNGKAHTQSLGWISVLTYSTAGRDWPQTPNEAPMEISRRDLPKADMLVVCVLMLLEEIGYEIRPAWGLSSCGLHGRLRLAAAVQQQHQVGSSCACSNVREEQHEDISPMWHV